ncbi:MAG: hypothetical protein L6Q71_09170 [Planctomycetes bacterium]|nr:hypothetical protein [Planctomycetota bacterium]NUQ34665.1 PD40 domain-containing protein [Planctomycetaceae bacterium]
MTTKKQIVGAAFGCVLLSACAGGPSILNSDPTPANELAEDFMRTHGGPDSNMAPANVGPFTIHTSRGRGADTHPEITGSGDDTWLYFSSDRDGSGHNIYRKRPDGKSLEMITSDASDELWPRVSPCGCCLAFGSNKLGNWDIYLLDLRNLKRPPVVLTAGCKNDDIHPTWAPDGSGIVYASWADLVDDYVLTMAQLSCESCDMPAKQPEMPAENKPASMPGVDGNQNFVFAELPGMTKEAPADAMPEKTEGYPMVTSRGPLLTNHGEMVTGMHPDFRPVKGEKLLVYQDYRKSGVAWNGVRTYDLMSGIVTLLQTSDMHGAIQPRWNHDGSRIVYTTVAKDGKPENACGGDGFGVATPDGQLIFDVRNPTFMNKVADPTWVRYMGEDRVFFSAMKDESEFIASVKIEK